MWSVDTLVAKTEYQQCEQLVSGLRSHEFRIPYPKIVLRKCYRGASVIVGGKALCLQHAQYASTEDRFEIGEYSPLVLCADCGIPSGKKIKVTMRGWYAPNGSTRYVDKDLWELSYKIRCDKCHRKAVRIAGQLAEIRATKKAINALNRGISDERNRHQDHW